MELKIDQGDPASITCFESNALLVLLTRKIEISQSPSITIILIMKFPVVFLYARPLQIHLGVKEFHSLIILSTITVSD